MNDSQYAKLPTPGVGLDHGYGPQVHLLSYAYPMTLLARLGAQDTVQPQVNNLVATLYDWMLGEVTSRLLTRKPLVTPTRMNIFHAEGVYEGQGIDPKQRVVVVDIARAGIIPSLRVYHGLHHLIEPARIRQDHIVASRRTNDNGEVVGLDMNTTKLGGPIDDATVLIPDPMGATGTSTAGVIQHYHDHAGGTPRAVATMHLIVTPEYLARMTREFPDLYIFAVRVDRGLSHPDVLLGRPGDRWDEEVGLDERQYIVPGAGGVGEVLNNAWV